MSRIQVITKDLSSIFFETKYSARTKLRISYEYFKIIIKRFFFQRTDLFFDFNSHSFLGFKLYLSNFSDFYWVFRDVFIYEEYFFSTNKQNPVVFDCGGNIGITVAYFKYLYPGSKISVFEPEDVNYNLLKKNIEKNNLSDVQLFKVALSNNKGTMTLFGNRILSTIHSGLMGEQKKLNPADREHTSEVSVEKLSSYLRDIEEVDYLKLDIEGAETNVIDDLFNNNCLKKVLKCGMEFHYFDKDSNSLADIIDFFEKMDFNIGFKMRTCNAEDVSKNEYYNFMVYSVKK